MAGRSQPASMRISAAFGLEQSQVIQVMAASLFSLASLTTQALEKKWVAFCVMPGSTAMSHSKSQLSAKVLNDQMPVGIMPRRPLMKRSQSLMPPICSAVGWTLLTSTRSAIIWAAATFSGELIVNSVLSSLSRLPPNWAQAL